MEAPFQIAYQVVPFQVDLKAIQEVVDSSLREAYLVEDAFLNLGVVLVHEEVSLWVIPLVELVLMVGGADCLKQVVQN